MEDSGFDSGDRVANFMQNYTTNKNNSNFINNNNNINCVESENSSNEDILNVKGRSLSATSKCDNIDALEYRNPSIINPIQTSPFDGQVPIEQQKKFHHLNEHNKKLSNIKGLQRKLEQKVERAKKNFLQNERLNQLENDIDFPRKSGTNLIPISRLPFPRNVESQRLVEYKSDNSDDEDVATFFPVHKRKPRRKMMKNKEEVDTFSIQEMTIVESDSNDGDKSSEDDDDDDDFDSQLNLELPPRTNESFIEKVRHALCCTRSAHGMF